VWWYKGPRTRAPTSHSFIQLHANNTHKNHTWADFQNSNNMPKEEINNGGGDSQNPSNNSNATSSGQNNARCKSKSESNSGCKQFQELNNYRMTNWKSLVRLRENTRSPNSKYWKSCFGSPWIKYSLIFTVLYNYILFYIWYIWYYNDYFYIYRYFNGPYHLLCQLSIYNEYLPKNK